MTRAFAYARTSSASNVGETKDSELRQREAISTYAAANGIEIVETFYDPAVRGTDEIQDRPGFGSLLTRIEENGVRLVLVEDSSRLARKMLTSELAIALLVQRGVKVFDSHGNDLTETDDEMRIAIRQFQQVFSQLEKSRLVKKLKHGRDTKRALTGRCEGAFGFDRTAPALVAAAHEIAATGLSLRKIAAELEARGYVTNEGKRFAAQQVARLLRYDVPVATDMVTIAARDADELGAAASATLARPSSDGAWPLSLARSGSVPSLV